MKIKKHTTMKRENQTTVSIPKATLNALKNMLFSKEGIGVNLTNIVNDLAFNEEQKDLIAINVALAYKGIKADVDNATRYEHDYSNYIAVHEFVDFSLIHGVVKTNSYRAQWNGSELARVDNECHSNAYGLDQWEQMTTDFHEILNRI